MLKNWSIALLFFIQVPIYAQTTLEEFISLAAKNSYTAKTASNNFQLANITYKTFRLSLKPALSFGGNVPVFNKDNYAVTQPDGSILFLSRSQNYSNIGFGFSQPVVATGGIVSVNTDIYRFDDFVAKTKQYNGTPVFLRLSQPLFSYNSFKWNKKIEPLKLQEAASEQKISMHQSAYEICRLYFDVITAQVNEQIAATNFQNSMTNLTIERRKVELGVSTEDKVLQLEMQQLNSEQDQAAAQSAIQKAFLALRTFIISSDTGVVQLQLPERLPVFNTDKEEAIAAAKKNLPQFLSYYRKKLEAESKVAEAKTKGRKIDLIASYGLNNAAADLSGIYRNPQDQQRFSIGFNIPIADWGRRKNELAFARLQKEQVEINNMQEEAALLADITNLVSEIQLLKININKALQLDTLAEKRFSITNRLYQSGKATLLEMQAAQLEKDNAKRNYVNGIKMFWETYYLFRLKTGMEL